MRLNSSSKQNSDFTAVIDPTNVVFESDEADNEERSVHSIRDLWHRLPFCRQLFDQVPGSLIRGFRRFPGEALAIEDLGC
jgi:hypothetical protein